MKIGGEFELSADFFARPALDQALPAFPMQHGVWLDTGRSALNLAARLAKRRGARRAHVPAYICHSAVEPLEAAGLEIEFYAGVPFGRPVIPDSLAGGDLLLVAHYFGMKNRLASDLAEHAHRAGAIVVEDLVQSSLSDGIAPQGDYVVTSLRKFTASPDGAFLGAREPIDLPVLPPDETTISLRLEGKLARGAHADASRFLPLLAQAEDRLVPDAPRAMSQAGQDIMARSDLAAIRAARRANWERVDEAFAPLFAAGRLERFMPTPDRGMVPLGYPVRVAFGQRDALAAALRGREIFCPVHWLLPHLGGRQGFEDERQCAAELLTFPIDQRYDTRDIDRMCNAVLQFEFA